MKEIERRTENIAKVLAQEAGKPMAMMELFLGEAYNLVYFGDKNELARIEDKVKWFTGKSRQRLLKGGSIP